MTLFGVFARSDFQLAPSSRVQSKRWLKEGEARKQEEQKRSFRIFLIWHQMKMICQSFLFPFKLNSNRLPQSNANNYSAIGVAEQHGLKVKLSGFPGLTTKMMPPGSQQPSKFFFKLCSYSLFSISITCFAYTPLLFGVDRPVFSYLNVKAVLQQYWLFTKF